MNETPTPNLALNLEDNLRGHEIGAEIFAPFVIERFGTGDSVAFADLSVTLTDAEGQAQNRNVRLIWNPQSAATKPFAVQERVRTEWGALGVACALMPSLLGLRVLSVAIEGERFDYRVGDGIGEWGMEISGTLSESVTDLQERQRLKIRQLRENPVLLSGYVVVVGFTLREVRISFHVPHREADL